MKLHKHDMTSSYDEFLCYAKSYKLILTTSMTHPVNNETPYLYSERATLSNFYPRRKTDNYETDPRLSSIFHRPFYLPRMFERYTLSTTYFPSQSFDETGCDHLVFPMPGKKDHVTVDIYYLLEDRKGIHAEEINLLDFKEWHDLPSWYPIFQLPYESTQKLLVPASNSTSKSSTLICRLILTFLRPTFPTNQVTSSYDTYMTALTTQIHQQSLKSRPTRFFNFKSIG